MSYRLTCDTYTVDYSPENVFLEVKTACAVHRWRTDRCCVVFADGHETAFSDVNCVSSLYETGVRSGVRAVYDGFKNSALTVTTTVSIDTSTEELNFELTVNGDREGELASVFWPAAFDFTAERGEGYSVYPQMQGILLPAKWDKPIHNYNNGKLYERDAYMPFFGQVEKGHGYMEIFDTAWDAGYSIDHTPSVSTYIRPYFRTSLGYMAYTRRIICLFFDKCDYVTFCKRYRRYLKAKGEFVTLAQKTDKNPTVAYLKGAPIVHTGTAVHISPKSQYYHKDEPSLNDTVTTFAKTGELLEKLKAQGVEKAYLHLDGWGKHGYDNLHPDVFPPNEAAGGASGMKALAEKVNGMGYLFGIHDQYRDYYYDAETFDEDNAIQNIDGSHPYCSIWYGGEQTILCQMLAPDYVRRNYSCFKKLGIPVKGAYLDVFSVVELDECFNPNHRMTRRQSAEKRNECFEILNSEGIIPSSEEAIDFALTSIALCHHAPFATTALANGEAMGIPVPLLNLVYHECLVIPWSGLTSKGGWGIPDGEWGYLYALLCAGTVYYGFNETEESLSRGKTALELQSRLFGKEMVSHEFLSDDYKRQRAVYSDGTTVTVDFNTDKYTIEII